MVKFLTPNQKNKVQDIMKVCTSETPMQKTDDRKEFRHPDAKFVREIDEDHGDQLWECVHCEHQWVKEGWDY